MVKKLILHKINYLKNAIAVVLVATFASCSGQPGGCVKCIENKPAPTPYSTTLNAINHAITVDQARTMTQTFATQRENMLAPEFRGRNILPLHETFNLKAIDTLLCQQKAVGFRIYMAMDAQQKVRFVLVGVDGDGKDIMQRVIENPTYMTTAPAGTSILLEESGQRYP